MFAGNRMPKYRREHSPGAQLVSGRPFAMDFVVRAIRLDFSAPLGLEYRLPPALRQVMVIAHEHPAKALEFIAHTRIESFVHFARIDDRRLPAPRCGNLAPKCDPARKSQRRGMFIVRSNLLIGGILCRRVDRITNLLAPGNHFRMPYGFGDKRIYQSPESFDGIDVEAAK